MGERAIFNRQRFLDMIAQKEGVLHSDYVNYSTKVELECQAGHRWFVTPNHVANGGSWCPKCPKVTSVKSKENFLQIVRERGGTLISDYVNNNTYVTIRCHVGHEWQVTPHSIAGVMNSWCPACSNNCPKQAATNFYTKIREHGGIALGAYEGAYIPIRVRCDKGHEWDCIPHNLSASNAWCARCYGNSSEQACERFVQTVVSKGGTLVEPYVNSWTRVRVRCNKGHEWDCIPGSVNHGVWCRACAGTCPIEAYKRLCKIVQDNEGEILDDYINSQTKIRFKCKFGHVWETCPTNITNSGCFCPTCKASHGERTVRHILEKHNIQFTAQKEHSSLFGYRFDFYFIHNGKEFYLEYDGEQHFRWVDFFYKTEEDYQHRRDIDVLKSHTVITNGGYLIRLDYTLTDEQIESHILTALNATTKLYVSNRDMYTWILQGVDPKPIQLTLNVRVPAQPIIPPIHLMLNIIKEPK